MDRIDRYICLSIIFIVYLCTSFIQCQSKSDPTSAKKQLEELEEISEKQREQNLAKVYSPAKAHEFLSYDKCIQRMKCPVNRQEECSEECRAGNTEEEIEEHIELTKDENRSSFKKAPKQKFESNANAKKRGVKSKTTTTASTGKTDL